MSIYIHKCNTISVFDSFEDGILAHIHEKGLRKLIEPDYKSIIPAAHLRRMSKVIRMGVAAALKTKTDYLTEGIIVGSGLGCFDNSAIFTKEYLIKREGLLSPTAFIQSTDNTIAGQIGLILKDNSYNITYLHKGIAFENALTDAILLAAENGKNVLLGAVDEKVELFDVKNEKSKYWLGEGASFFILSAQNQNALACIKSCTVISVAPDNITLEIKSFLARNSFKKPDLVLYGNSFLNEFSVPKYIDEIEVVDYSALCGVYFSNSAFGTQLAVEIIASGKYEGKEVKRILLVNNFFDKDFGIIYLTENQHE